MHAAALLLRHVQTAEERRVLPLQLGHLPDTNLFAQGQHLRLRGGFRPARKAYRAASRWQGRSARAWVCMSSMTSCRFWRTLRADSRLAMRLRAKRE